ncbi:30S ribosomal protein S13 [Candidatus Peregrinibacteria bacterium]|nr:MAG: 30S ribosomal protein S13 [Candidatus Peregrinibacteria bacterium]
MARVAGVIIPDDKRIVIGLTYVFGIGPTLSEKILDVTKIDKNTRVKELTDAQLNLLLKEIQDNYVIEADLRRQVSMDIKRLQEIGCYRGLRHRLRLPVRGQTTKRNARTRKGARRTVANKKG